MEQRELKFRSAHYNHDGTFNGFTYWGLLYTVDVETVSCFTSPTWRRGTHRKVEEQYTGLKDKNGVEIYEGDVISSDTVGTVKHPVETYIHLVEWKGLGFHFKSLDKGLKGVLSNTMLHSPEQVTVIGNIHQHPELLKGDQQNG